MRTSLKAVFYAPKLLLYIPFFAVRKKFPFSKTKRFSFAQTLRTVRKSCLFTYKKPFIHTNLFLFLSKVTLFHPPLSISTTLNLLFAKNAAVLLMFALILCCKAGASHRFKSLPAIPGEVAAFRKTGYLMNAGHFRFKSVSTGDLNRGRRTESRVLFGYFLHDAKSDNPFSLQRTSRFCKPRISAHKQQPRTNQIKSFCRSRKSCKNFAVPS